MTETIWKFPIPHLPIIEHPMPLGAELLHLGVQGAEGQLWVRVNPDNPQVSRRFALVGTGHDLPFTGGAYVGSFQVPPYVWHLFEIVEGEPSDRTD